MNITIASGKGGTGKTTFAVNLAYALARRGDAVRLLDCDVEEPNDHLFVNPAFNTEQEVQVLKPVWDAQLCDACGKCVEACRYNALALVKKQILIFNELCHACGVCSHVCPHKAFRETPVSIGRVQTAEAPMPFFFAHGRLNIGEALAPVVVAAVKKHMRPDGINLLDVAPGVACPVVKALEGAEVAVLLTEPTPFGLNDLRLAASLALNMKIPTGIVINRSDGQDQLIADFAQAAGIPILGRIPFQRAYAETYATGQLLLDHHPEMAGLLLEIYEHIVALRSQPPAQPPVIPAFQLREETPPPFQDGTASDYQEIAIISGKGGTGKTTLTASLAVLARQSVLADNDVDAADLHLLLAPQLREMHEFVGGSKAVIDASLCIGCGRCVAVCRFEAIHLDGPANDLIGQTYRVAEVACEGCGLCPLVCPAEAIQLVPEVTGEWYVSGTAHGPMVHARLSAGAENSGRLVSQVRNCAADLARELRHELILGDGPPGTACPVIAAVTGADLVLIVTEPTVSGVHDLERVLELTAHFAVPALVIINKADLNAEQVARIEELAQARQSRVIAKIPFDVTVHDALMAGRVLIEFKDCAAAQAVTRAWQEIRRTLQERS